MLCCSCCSFSYCNPSPFQATPQAKRLPIDIYEQEIRVVDGVPKSFFAHLTYKIETGESERIAVDHIAHVRPIAEGDSALAAHLEGVQNAIQMLNLRVTNLQRAWRRGGPVHLGMR